MTKKEYEEIISELIKAREKQGKLLRRTQKMLDRLERLLQWMTEQCLRTGAMFCGLHCIYKNGEQSGPDGNKEVEDYVGFLLFGKGMEWRKNSMHNYEIRGYLASSAHKCISDCCYHADVYQHLSSIPHGITNMLELGDNKVSKGHWHRGIGTAGMRTVKNLAYQLHCSSIYGTKMTNPDSEVDMDTLTDFYNRNGFSQAADSNRIFFSMDRYHEYCNPCFGELDDKESAGLWGMMDRDRKEKMIVEENRERLAVLCATLVREGQENVIPEVLRDDDKKETLLEKHGLKLPDWMKL